ncbi:MAG: aldehyde ferredoxin oxidoreductase N-terminal domain-containing protein, partial [Promethearchaeia archaeon]
MYGKLLRINLNNNTFETEEIESKFIRKYLGGRGLGAKILYDELKPGIDALSPENIVIIASGPLTGTKAASSGRYAVVTKSPLTGAILSANSGGDWGPYLRRSGFDGIVIKGKAEHPTYLWIHNGEVEFKDASHVWGKKVIEADETL